MKIFSSYFKVIGCILLSTFILAGCKKDPPAPNNPFDQYAPKNQPNNTTNPDSASILGLHTYLFQPSCATPACHDGTFEPDFRTVQSSYSTLVWQKPYKNTLDSAFKYRVFPYQADNSWLVERLVTDDSLLGRMPIYSPAIDANMLAKVKEWINNGAPDISGNIIPEPDLQPRLQRLWTFYINEQGWWQWISRTPWNAPLPLPAGKEQLFFAYITDDFTAQEDLDVVLECSSNEDFSGTMVEIPVQYGNTDTMYIENYDSLGYNVSVKLSTRFQTSLFTPNVIYYFRFRIKDTTHASPIYFPNDRVPEWYLPYFRLIVQ